MTDDNGDFKNHPVSISEIKSSKAEKGSYWTPRDCLISVLRDIDDGNLNPDAIVISWTTDTGDGTSRSGYSNSGPNIETSLGVLESTKFKIWEDGSE